MCVCVDSKIVGARYHSGLGENVARNRCCNTYLYVGVSVDVGLGVGVGISVCVCVCVC